MSGWVAIVDVAVSRGCNDLPVADDDCADRNLALLLRFPRMLQGDTHEIFVGHQTLRSAGDVFFCFDGVPLSACWLLIFRTTTV